MNIVWSDLLNAPIGEALLLSTRQAAAALKITSNSVVMMAKNGSIAKAGTRMVRGNPTFVFTLSEVERIRAIRGSGRLPYTDHRKQLCIRQQQMRERMASRSSRRRPAKVAQAALAA